MQTQAQIEREIASSAVLTGPATKLGTPLRVLHVISYMGRGGAEMGILKLIAGLGGDFEQRICTTRGYDANFVQSHFSEQKMYTAGRADLELQFPIFRLARIMREYRPHIVHTRNWGAIEAVAAAKLAGVPVVIHSEHGYEVDMFAGLPMRRRLFRRTAYAMADAIFAVTRELRDFHARQAWIRPDRMGVMYNGVDTQRFAPSIESRAAMRKELGLPSDSFVVGAVGRLVPIKDHQTMLKAAAFATKNGTNVRVLLVGSGPERERLQTLSANTLEGRVYFAGDSSRVPELLNAMDVFVLPSLNEGMSNTLLEAMACGLPALATNVGGNPEIIKNNVNGCLFTPGDTTWLAEKLQNLARNPGLVHQLGTAARNHAIESFGLSRMLESYRSFYLDLAARRQVAAARTDTAHVRN
ncbi:MAG TPA: glycosyltransferase [Candidatus Acidoferrum sp.]|nr:glycosyltransferase [Candidatus Acidoferrum sp.]